MTAAHEEATPAPTVSVIVPVYNAHRYLQATVESILGQTYRRLEVILVDDGATDGSGELCDRFAELDERVVVVHQTNGGIGSAQNAGLDTATGDLVTFCDNDDLMAPRLIERLVQILLDADADMSCCRWQNVGASHAAAALARTPSADGVVEVFSAPAKAYQSVFSVALRRLFHQELRYFSEANWGKLYRAELFDGIRFPEGRFAQDVAVAMPLYLRMRTVASCSDELYLWLQRGDSVSHSLRATSYYSDIVEAHAQAFESSLAEGILPGRASYGLSALRWEKRSARTPADSDLYRADRGRVRSLRARLRPTDRVRCAVLSLIRHAEVFVYDRTVHRRR